MCLVFKSPSTLYNEGCMVYPSKKFARGCRGLFTQLFSGTWPMCAHVWPAHLLPQLAISHMLCSFSKRIGGENVRLQGRMCEQLRLSGPVLWCESAKSRALPAERCLCCAVRFVINEAFLDIAEGFVCKQAVTTRTCHAPGQHSRRYQLPFLSLIDKHRETGLRQGIGRVLVRSEYCRSKQVKRRHRLPFS